MIFLTKLDGTKVLLNFDSIKFIESSGDTRVAFVNGDTLIVRESLEEIQENMIKLKASVIQHANKNSIDNSQGI